MFVAPKSMVGKDIGGRLPVAEDLGFMPGNLQTLGESVHQGLGTSRVTGEVLMGKK